MLCHFRQPVASRNSQWQPLDCWLAATGGTPRPQWTDAPQLVAFLATSATSTRRRQVAAKLYCSAFRLPSKFCQQFCVRAWLLTAWLAVWLLAPNMAGFGARVDMVRHHLSHN